MQENGLFRVKSSEGVGKGDHDTEARSKEVRPGARSIQALLSSVKYRPVCACRSREHDRQTVGSHQEEEMEIEEEREEVGEGDAAGMGAVYSGQSELERAVMAAATSHS